MSRSVAWTDERKAKLRGRVVSAETRAKMRAAKLGTKQSPEHRANRSAALKGSKSSALSILRARIGGIRLMLRTGLAMNGRYPLQLGTADRLRIKLIELLDKLHGEDT